MSDIIAMLDTLADYKAQRDLIDIRKRELLDTVKVPAEIIAAQDAANKASVEIEKKYRADAAEIRTLESELLAKVIKPELPAEYLADLAQYERELQQIRDNTEAHYDIANTRAVMAKAKTAADLQAKTAQVYAELAARKNEIEAEFGQSAAAVDANIEKLRGEIKAATIEHGATVKGKVFSAIFVKGRVSWSTDKLDGMMALIPQLKEARTVGEPSVTIR